MAKNVSVMNYNRIRDIVLNLGNKDVTTGGYIPNEDCLSALKKLEEELKTEDGVKRNVRMTIHICGTIKNDLLPIISSKVDPKLFAVALRILVNLSWPVENLLPNTESPSSQNAERVRKHLLTCALGLKKAFLEGPVTSSLVTFLRDSILKSEKHRIPLLEDECDTLKNCLLLLKNALHLPDFNVNLDEESMSTFSDWQSIQSKLIWNLFIHGIGGALLLMLKSEYSKQWTVPITLILGSIYRNQNLDNVYQTLETVQIASSDTEGSENGRESDDSKGSNTSSNTLKSVAVCIDSGCPLTDEAHPVKTESRNSEQSKDETSNTASTSQELHTDLENVKINDDLARTSKSHPSRSFEDDRKVKLKVALSVDGVDYGSSSPCVSPYHKRVKGNPPNVLNEVPLHDNKKCKTGSGLNENNSSDDLMDSKSADDISDDGPGKPKSKKLHRRNDPPRVICKAPESDCSTGVIQDENAAVRCLKPNLKRNKVSRNCPDCSPSICMDSAQKEGLSKGRVKYPLWGKRISVSNLVGIDSSTPSSDEIANLLKEFSLSFLHSGFCKLVLNLKDLFAKGQPLDIDKSIFFWLMSYFLPLARAVNICLNHVREIITTDIIGILVFECVHVCEILEMQSNINTDMVQYVTVQMKLLLIALKEIMFIIDHYSQKYIDHRDRAFFDELNAKLAGSQDIRNLPILLFHVYPRINTQQFLEDVAIINHYMLTIIARGSCCWGPITITFNSHLREFCQEEVVHCYGKLLDNYKTNGKFLNECVFTMLHHIVGEMHSVKLLIVPSIVKTFSQILRENFRVSQYQKDLMWHVLNKYKMSNDSKETELESGSESDDSSDESCISSNFVPPELDDLYWWYLQFEQDTDPISRIAEHIPMSKPDILFKLKLKGYISLDDQKLTEEKKEDIIVGTCFSEPKEVSNNTDDITKIMQTLVRDGHLYHLLWLQKVLLETCHAKRGLKTAMQEPLPYFSIKMRIPVPLVPYREDQRKILRHETFIHLLRKLGLHLGSETFQMYPRIPFDFTEDVLFSIASRLGPISKDEMKFTCEDRQQSNTKFEEDETASDKFPLLPFLPSCCTQSSWLPGVQQSKGIYMQENAHGFTPSS